MKKDFVARELTREVIVGAFMVMIFLGLGYFTIILSRETWFGSTYEMNVVFDHIGGLREGDNVTVRGMPVGKVKKLNLIDEDVHVRLRLDERLRMKKDYVIRILPSSVLGGRYLDVFEGSPDHGDLALGGRFVGQTPHDLMADAGELVSNLRQAFVEGGIISDIQLASSRFREIADRLYEGQGTLGRLLAPNDTLMDDVAATAASLRKVAERLEAGEGALGKLMAPDTTVFEDIAAASASLRAVTEKLEKGEGTLGRLVNEDAVYGDVQAILREARAALDDYRETSPIVTFTSVFFGAL